MFELVGKLEELKNQFKLRVVVDQTPILLLYFMDIVYAIQDKCPHLGVSLEQGRYNPNSGNVTCRGHGATIDIRTGDITEKAHIAIFKLPTKKAKTFETKVENGLIYLKK